MNRQKIEQLKLQYWAGVIHECHNSGLKKKQWLDNHGISRDAYYYWYKKVQTACVEAMELPDTLSVPEFAPLPVPVEAVNEAKTASTITSPAVVTVHVGKASVDIPETTSMDFIQKLIGALAHVK